MKMYYRFNDTVIPHVRENIARHFPPTQRFELHSTGDYIFMSLDNVDVNSPWAPIPLDTRGLFAGHSFAIPAGEPCIVSYRTDFPADLRIELQYAGISSERWPNENTVELFSDRTEPFEFLPPQVRQLVKGYFIATDSSITEYTDHHSLWRARREVTRLTGSIRDTKTKVELQQIATLLDHTQAEANKITDLGQLDTTWLSSESNPPLAYPAGRIYNGSLFFNQTFVNLLVKEHGSVPRNCIVGAIPDEYIIVFKFIDGYQPGSYLVQIADGYKPFNITVNKALRVIDQARYNKFGRSMEEIQQFKEWSTGRRRIYRADSAWAIRLTDDKV